MSTDSAASPAAMKFGQGLLGSADRELHAASSVKSLDPVARQELLDGYGADDCLRLVDLAAL